MLQIRWVKRPGFFEKPGFLRFDRMALDYRCDWATKDFSMSCVTGGVAPCCVAT